ncbi:hypothetical protein SAMN04489725_106126 [Alicyclobacillus hesperidum]|uniref:Uncharacterized protein n=1 Tax=Alicyclobacillus hesperidum TaxID=89784 RepID=A0A1H2TTI9_9BACL|nr:DUF5317 family protein [Alicyclobacillus hesperidum]SDW47175.1 hypothetical protein SAMN04489725_106126 [Alicyclobacillus hesperidum]
MPYCLVVPVLLMLIFRRSFLSLIEIRFRFTPLLLIGIVGQIAADNLRTSVAYGLLPLSMGFVVIWLYLNRKVSGLRFVLAGTTINLIAIVISGGKMPVLLSTVHFLHLEVAPNTGTRHSFATMHGWWWLGDWIPIPPFIMSPGDILVGIGLSRFVLTESQTRASYQNESNSQ